MFSAPTRRAMLALAAGDLEGTQSDRDACREDVRVCANKRGEVYKVTWRH